MASEILQKEEKSSQIHSLTVQGQAGQFHTGTVKRTRTLLELELRTRPPVGEEDEQIGGINNAATIKVSWSCCTPLSKECK